MQNVQSYIFPLVSGCNLSWTCFSSGSLSTHYYSISLRLSCSPSWAVRRTLGRAAAALLWPDWSRWPPVWSVDRRTGQTESRTCVTAAWGAGEEAETSAGAADCPTPAPAADTASSAVPACIWAAAAAAAEQRSSTRSLNTWCSSLTYRLVLSAHITARWISLGLGLEVTETLRCLTNDGADLMTAS